MRPHPINKQSMKTRFAYKNLLLVPAMALMLNACSGEDNTAGKREQYAAYTQADLQQLFDTGQYETLLDAITFYRDEGTATTDQLELLANVYRLLGDGVGMEVIVERLRERGVAEPDSALLLASAFVLQYDYEAAEAALAEQILPPEDAFEGLLLRGDIMKNLGNRDQAERYYRLAVRIEPENSFGRTALALFLLEKGQQEEAVQVFSEVSAQDIKDKVIVSYAAGMVNRYSGKIDEALIHFENAVSKDPQDVLSRLELAGIFLSKNQVELAQAQLDAVYEIFPNNPMAHFYTALMLVRDGRFDEAEDLLIRTGDFTKAYPLAARVYGLTMYELKKYTLAIPYLNWASSVFPGHVPSRMALADSLLHSGDNDNVLAVLKPLLDAGENAEAHAFASTAASRKGYMGDARRYSERALALAATDNSLSPERVSALRQQAAFSRYYDDDLEGAQELLSTRTGNTPDDIALLVHQANMLMASGKTDQVSGIVDTVLELDPDNAIGQNLRGAVLFQEGQIEDSIEAYNRALAISPDYESAMKNRAISYIQAGKASDARSDLAKLIELAPNDNQVVSMYGQVLLAMNEAEAALPYLERAVAIYGDSVLVNNRYAAALAGVERFDEAIQYGERAQILGREFPEFSAFIQEQLVTWREAKQAADAEAADERAQEQAQQDADRAAEDALEQQLREQGQLTDAEKMNEEQRLARNELFGSWMADELGLDADQKAEYVQSIIEADEQEPGNTDIVRKAISDLEAAGKRATIQAIEMKLAEFAEQVEAGS